MRSLHCGLFSILLVLQLFSIHPKTASAQDSTEAIIRDYLCHVDYYRFSSVQLLEVDSISTARFRETFTPELPRTQGLELAEQACTSSAEIRRRTSNGQYIAQFLIDGTTAPQDCEVVKNYYSQVANILRIKKMFVLVEKTPTSVQSKGKPRILGVIPYCAPPREDTFRAAQPEMLYWYLCAPAQSGMMTASDLREFSTKEYEIETTTKQKKSVKGSIEKTPYANMYEHLEALIIAGKLINRTNEIRPCLPQAIKPKTTETHVVASQAATQPSYERVDNDAMPYLTRWSVCDPATLALARIQFHNVGKLVTDSTLVITGIPKQNGSYSLVEMRCGKEVLTVRDIALTCARRIQEMLGSPVNADGSEAYCHNALHISLVERP
jgi:hypothetical protein